MRKQIIKGQDVIFHPIKEHFTTAIWLHGLGDNAFGWSDIFEVENPFSTTTKIFLPTAPTRKMGIRPSSPLTGWYGVNSLDKKFDIETQSLLDSQAMINQYIEIAIKEVGEKNVYIGGFSQGGTMATLCGLQYKLKGIISLAAPLLPRKYLKTEFYKKCPILSRVGTMDNIVPIGQLRDSWKKAQKMKNVDYKEYHCGHALTYEMIDDIQKWI